MEKQAREPGPIRGDDDGRNGGSVPRVRAVGAALALAIFGVLYFFLRQGLKDGVWRFNLPLVNKSLGAAALVLLSLSMLLTGLAYFSKRGGRRLAGRRSYGLAGFWTGLVHAAVTHLALPAAGLAPERRGGAWLSDGPGLAAIIIFAVMAVLSLPGTASRLGGGRWRRILRYLGYTALVLAAAHAAVLKAPSWTKYLRTFDPPLPSLSLPAALVAAAAVLLRAAVWIAERSGKGRARSSGRR